MAQFNVITTGNSGTVQIPDLHLTLTHPQTIDLINDTLEKFTWAEILESNDLQSAIDAGDIVCEDENTNPISAVTLDRLATSATGSVQDQIVDGVTTIAPSQNAVFDALALKFDAANVSAFGASLIDDPDAATARGTLGLGTAATSDVGDFATAAQGALADSAVQPGDNVSDLANDAGYVDAAGAAAAAPIQTVFGRSTSAIVAVASDYDDSQIDFTYSPNNFTATSAFVRGALEGIDNALGAIAGDGNDTPVVRGNATQGVAPTAIEVPNPISGDTASVYLTSGVLEKWVYDSSWTLAYTLDANTATNLGYTPSATNGIVTSSTGTNATIPLANGTNAGLFSPGDFNKLGFITVTQAVDLDALETDSHAAVTLGGGNDARLSLSGQELTLDGSDIDSLITLSGVAAGSNNLGTFTGSTITDNVTTKVALQELETAIETNASANVYGSNFNLFQSTGVSTTTLDTFQVKISDTTSALQAGDYKIIVSYSWNHNATQNDFEGRFLFDGAAVGESSTGLIHKQEPKDAAGNDPVGSGSNQRHAFTKIFYVTGVTAGAKSVELAYRTDAAGVASSIWDASIEIVRVA